MLTYSVLASIFGFIIDWIDKQWFIFIANTYVAHGKLSEKAANAFSIIINSRKDVHIAYIIFIIIIFGFICFIFIQRSAQLNWSASVTLEKVIEFRKAMEAIDIFKPEERIEFVIKNKLPLYISYTPILGIEQEQVNVKYYACSNYTYFISANTINTYTGEQRLCIEWNDYQYILKNYEYEKKSAYVSKIADLESSLANMKGTLSVLHQDIHTLEEEKKNLAEKNRELSQKLQTLPGREENTEKRARDRIIFWRVAAPLVNRLIAEAPPGMQYSRPQIQTAFERELETVPELKAAIQKLLHTSKKEAQHTPLALDGWAMELIRAALGDLAKKDPGATRKKEK